MQFDIDILSNQLIRQRRFIFMDKKTKEKKPTEKKPMEKKAKIIVIISTIALILIAIYLLCYALIRTKVVEINEWFLPKNAITGVSISSHQGKVDMEQLADQDIQFALIKATEGTTNVDKYFAANWENAKAAGIPASAYHFFSFSTPGDTQAQNYIDTVGKNLDGRLIPAVDIQYTAKYSKQNPPAKAAVRREFTTYLNIIENYYGVKPIIYTDKEFYDDYLDGIIDGYDLWVSNSFHPASWDGWKDWTIWHYCQTDELKGISSDYINLNVLADDTTLADLTYVAPAVSDSDLEQPEKAEKQEKAEKPKKEKKAKKAA